VPFLAGNDLREDILKFLFSLYTEVHHKVKPHDAAHFAYANSPLQQKNFILLDSPRKSFG